MAVFRVERNTGYTVMSNHTCAIGTHLKGKRLAFANAVFARRLGLYPCGLISHQPREDRRIREAVKELEKAGYIVRSRRARRERTLAGRGLCPYTSRPQPREPEAATSGEQPSISDYPTLENPTLENPTLDNPTLEKPTLENPTQLNKDISSKEQSITDLSSTHSIPFHSPNPLPFAQDEAATPPERKRTEAKAIAQ